MGRKHAMATMLCCAVVWCGVVCCVMLLLLWCGGVVWCAALCCAVQRPTLPGVTPLSYCICNALTARRPTTFLRTRGGWRPLMYGPRFPPV